ncbi:MAG: PTS sugar transporter subunit IIA [Promicromonosporaceae bacterium]|nr:PTS sugar transporter subunit IIA [Promicromonosporaceae bacterium]
MKIRVVARHSVKDPPMNLAEYLPECAILTRAHAADWREAVRLAGGALTAQGVAAAVYTDEMIAAIEELGPYVVIAPGFALAHSRPSPAVNHTGISWVSLAEPVEFGAGENDPVRLIVGLAATDHNGHLDIMSALSEVLMDDDLLAAALDANNPAEVRALLSGAAP